MALTSNEPKSTARDTIDSALKDFVDVQSKLSALLNRIEACADVVGGAVPRDTSAKPDEPPSGSLVQKLHRSRREISNLIAIANDEIGRLEAALQN